MTPLLNITAVLMSTTTLFGILFHDMHLDRATQLALGIPVIATSIAGTAAADALLKKGHAHTHVHTVEAPKRHSVRVMPNMQAPRDDHRKNTSKKVQLHFGADNGIIWPST
ncbi:hypothetical protein KI440_00035 [Candidatus Saccharibacteria bacterium TM7i]|nr:hypothetical protein KI440_00035 [Candidatus Saccharibacteria bacterium TM7i]